jgi:hypothetical protein
MATLCLVTVTLTLLCLFTTSHTLCPVCCYSILYFAWHILLTLPIVFTAGTNNFSYRDDDFEIFDREFFNQQKAAEERIERERLDAEFACSIQNAPQMSESMNPQASSTPSAFDRMSGVRPQPSSSYHHQTVQPSSSSRKLPWAQNPSSNLSGRVKAGSITSGMKREPSTSNAGFGSNSAFKIKNLSRTMPGSFQDDSSNASDSDIEIIPASAFHDNGRQSQTRPGSSTGVYRTPQAKTERPGSSPEAWIACNAALHRFDQATTSSALQRAMYGNQAVPPWLSSNGQGSHFQTVRAPMNAASSVYSNPQLGLTNNVPADPTSQMYPPSGGIYVYPSASLGNGSTVAPGTYGGVFGASPGGGNMQNLGPALGYTLNNIPGAMGNGYSYNHPGPSQGFGGAYRRVMTDSFADISQHPNTYNELTDFLSHPSMASDSDNYIMNDPHKTTQELKELLENIRPDDEPEPEDREPTPEGLKESLVSDYILLWAYHR